MTRALAALLTRAIDYAGVFPPAKLELKTAVDKYSRYRTGPESWIVGKLVVRASQLQSLIGLITALNPHDPIPMSVIGHGGADRLEWETGLVADATAMNDFHAAVGELADIEAYEVRVPDNVRAVEWLKDLHGFSDADIFAEFAWDDHLADAIGAAAETDVINVKARTGGSHSTDFPTSQQVAGFIQSAVQLGVPFKFTAGLHHASPHYDPDLSTRMHGFVNVLAATAFADSHDLTLREIEAVLDADLPGTFAITDFGISGLEWSANLEELSEARELMVSFGSCSIEEPLEALRHAGLEID